MAHTFKPGDMAKLINALTVPEAEGMYCIVESNEYELVMPHRTIIVVEITIGHPSVKRANVNCLKYIPPEEWPESEFKQRELVRAEGVPHESNTAKRREPATAE